MSTKERSAGEAVTFSLVALALSVVACGAWTIGFVYGYPRILAPAAFLCLVAGVLGAIGLLSGIFRHKASRWLVYCACAILVVLPPLCFQAAFAIGARSRAAFEQTQTSRHNMRLLREAILSYVQTHDGHLPEAESWCDSLLSAAPSLRYHNFEHPVLTGVVIAYNSHLSELKLTNVAEDTVLLFEAKGGWNLTGSRELLQKNRSATRADIMLLNGKIETYWLERGGVWAYDDKFIAPRWDP
jgi:hypothetical protein